MRLPSASAASCTRADVFWHGVLVALVIASAFLTVCVKDLHRRGFIEYQAHETRYEQLLTQWSQLLLEQGTLSRQERIVSMAQRRWQMHMPRMTQVKMLVIPTLSRGEEAA